MSKHSMLPFRVIGLSGLAGSGKDMFCELLQKEVPNVRRFALADALKDELFHTLYSLYRVDIFKCTREEKNLIRPMLVAHGKVRRTQSDGTYWTSKLTTEINSYFLSEPNGIACVTDIRYDLYAKDECFWLKEVMGGKLVHISLYSDCDGSRKFVTPPNPEEAENDPKIQGKADYKVVWPKLLGPTNLQPDWLKLSSYVRNCIKHLTK